MNYKKLVAEIIKTEIDMDLDKIEELIEIPPNLEIGDFAFPCFKLSKEFRKSPNIIAQELKGKLNKKGFQRIENSGGYLNFFIDKNVIIKNTLEEIISKGESYGDSTIGEGKRFYVESSLPHIGKASEIEGFITKLIGNSIYKLLKKQGYIVYRLNNLGNYDIKFNLDEVKEFYNDKIEDVVNEIKERKLLTESNGVEAIMLEEYNIPPYIVLKENKVLVEKIIDLAAAVNIKKNYNFYKCIYVAGSHERLYFKQMFKVLELLGYKWAKSCVHISFGLIKFSGIKFSITKKEDIFLENLIKKSINKTLNIINEKELNLENKEEISKKIGESSIIFTCLKNSREKNIIFDWSEMFFFEEETYLYVQYSYFKAKSILSTAKVVNEEAHFSKLNSKEEFELVNKLKSFSDVVHNAAEKLEPFIVTQYVIEITRSLNKFYSSYPILSLEDKKLMKARLDLLSATCIVIKNSLDLIGIEVVEKI